MGRVKLKPDFTEEQLGINPLTQSMEIPIKSMSTKASMVDLKDVTFDDDMLLIGKTSKVENTYFVEKELKGTYYCRAGYRLHVNSRTPKAKSLLMWVMWDIEYNKDYIWINVDRYMNETDTSLNTYKDAVTELCREAILAPIVGFQNMYWINPVIFFKGNRVTKYPKNLKRV